MKIGVFDSGYGGLTILKGLTEALPDYDFIYLGDNARSPYGNRSFDVVYEYTLQAVKYLFGLGCDLIVLACNTASAKALRSIQQNDLPQIGPEKRVLGVVRPTVEVVGSLSKSRSVGILATQGTVNSHSFRIEIAKLAPDVHVYEQACPMWVPLIENNDWNNPGADYFIHKYTDLLMAQCPEIDTVLLCCTHYPIIKDKIRACLPERVTLVEQGRIVGTSLKDYLRRHSDIDRKCDRGGRIRFLTTENVEKFNDSALTFLGFHADAEKIIL